MFVGLGRLSEFSIREYMCLILDSEFGLFFRREVRKFFLGSEFEFGVWVCSKVRCLNVWFRRTNDARFGKFEVRKFLVRPNTIHDTSNSRRFENEF